MRLTDSVHVFQLVNALGMTTWLSIAALNNVHGFFGAVGAVGTTMSMTPLRQAPAIDTPLLARAIRSPALHRMALLLVLALQIIAAVTCAVGSYHLAIGGGLMAARPWLNLALSSLAASLFAMHLGGLWFAYWIRQEGLQLTHIALLIWTLAAFFLFNALWG